MVKNDALTVENDCGLNNLKLWPLVIDGLKVNSSDECVIIDLLLTDFHSVYYFELRSGFTGLLAFFYLYY